MKHDPFVGRFYQADGNAGAGGGTASAAATAPGTEPKPGEAKTFTEEQLNSIVSKRVNEVSAKFSDLAKASDEKIAAMQTQLDQRKIADAEGQKQYDEAKRLREEGFAKELEKERKAREQAETLYRTTAIRQSLTQAAAAQNAVDPADVVALLEGTIKIDDTGTPRFNDGTSVGDGVKKFLDSKPHMVRAGGRGGSGATNNGNRGEATPGSIQGMTVEQIRQPGMGRKLIERVAGGEDNPFRKPVNTGA